MQTVDVTDCFARIEGLQDAEKREAMRVAVCRFLWAQNLAPYLSENGFVPVTCRQRLALRIERYRHGCCIADVVDLVPIGSGN